MMKNASNFLKKVIGSLHLFGFRYTIAHFMKRLFPTWSATWPIFFGSLSRAAPFCTAFGFSRGEPISRYYVRKFIEQNKGDIHGKVLEFGSPYFTNDVDSAKTIVDIVDVDPQNLKATIIGDIHDFGIKENTYDAIICTQVLEHIANPFKASKELYRILKPGGTLLLTVPHTDKIHPMPTDYWRFTYQSIEMLFGKFSEASIVSFGNVHTVAAFQYGIAAEELNKKKLDYIDPDYPVVYGARLVK